MSLYPLLKDRASINILKILHDGETVEKKYCLSLDEVVDRLPVPVNGMTLRNLRSGGLISVEDSENNGTVLAITKKGKDFVSIFDKLNKLMNEDRQEVKAFSVEYDLADDARRLLATCFDMGLEDDGPVEIRTLALEMFPRTDVTDMLPELIHAADRLVDLNLLEKFEDGDEPAYAVTAIGERVVQDQLKEGH